MNARKCHGCKLAALPSKSRCAACQSTRRRGKLAREESPQATTLRRVSRLVAILRNEIATLAGTPEHAMAIDVVRALLKDGTCPADR